MSQWISFAVVSSRQPRPQSWMTREKRVWTGLETGTPLATLPGTWQCRTGTRTGWPGVSILWLGEIVRLACDLYLSVAALTNNNNNNDNNNCIQRRSSRFFTISSLHHKLSPTRTLKWPRHNRVKIMCNTSSAYHVQRVVCHLVGRDSSAIKFDRV